VEVFVQCSAIVSKCRMMGIILKNVGSIPLGFCSCFVAVIAIFVAVVAVIAVVLLLFCYFIVVLWFSIVSLRYC